MGEQRLIDANELKIMLEHEYRHSKMFKENAVYMGWQGAIQILYDQPTIDPETLPIVRQLRAELERVKAQRDELKETCLSLVLLCEKEYRRNNFGMYRDERNDDLKRLIEEMDAVLNAEKFKSRYRSWVIGRFDKVE